MSLSTPISPGEAQESMSLALAAAEIGTWDWNTSDGTLRWNGAMEELFGLRSGEFHGSYAAFLNLVHEEDRGRIKRKIDQAIQDSAAFSEEFRLHPLNSLQRDSYRIRLKLRTFRDEQRDSLRLIGCGWKVDNAEILSPGEKTQLTMLMEHLPDHIYFKDLESRFIAVNRAMAEWAGFSDPLEVLGKTDHDLFTIEHAERARKDELEIIDTGVAMIDREEKETWPNREDTWVATTKMPLRDQSGAIAGTFGLSRNVTERIRAANELKEFAYVVSHDLKAPLRGIASLVTWLSNDYRDKLDEGGRELLALLQSRVERMHQLIEGVLQLSRISVRKENLVETDLNEVVRQIIDSIDPPEGIRINIENHLPAIKCEPTRIAQVFQNLISNAIKYMGKPEGLVSIGFEPVGDGYKFYVSDDGIGIDPKYHEKIFQLFETLHSGDDYHSSGIGLSIVKKIVSQWGGKLWVVSTPGAGATFFFVLPSKPSEG